MKRILPVFLLGGLILLLSIPVIYGLWLGRLADAEAAFSDTRYIESQEQFQQVFSGWELSFLPRFLVEENRVRIVLNLIQIGYVLGEYDQTLEFLRGEGSLSALVSEPEYHFWMGNLLMAQALNQPDGHLIDTLVRCREEYLETLRWDADFWDAKYNYEYVNELLAQFQEGDSHSEEEIELLLDKVRTDMPRRKKVLPPEMRK
ncbi:MAG: hypothetical protein E2P05_01695 [Acidobacteria bacterium]|nr:MAG: hypothetical protein E2P05_01695 [Acidobacteriota bacterium]